MSISREQVERVTNRMYNDAKQMRESFEAMFKPTKKKKSKGA